MSNIGQPKIEIKKEMTSQPMPRDEQGQSLPKLLKIEGENIPSTSHHNAATSKQNNDWKRVNCNLCKEQYKDPRLLDCLHSFCLRCLDKHTVYRTSSEKQRLLPCPTCYKYTDVPPMGVLGLCKDTITSELVEEQAIKQQLLPQGPPILCLACNAKQLAVTRCFECNDFLCEDCTNAHQRFTKAQPHTVVTVDGLRSGKVILERKISVQKCRHHLEHDLNIFCNTCQEMNCLMCMTLNHCKPDHDFVDTQTAAASCRFEILKVLKPLEVGVKELQVAKTLVEGAKKKLESNVKEILDKIAKKKTSELGKLNRRAKSLKDKAESEAKERVEVLDKCLMVESMNETDTEFILEKARSIVEDGDCQDIITLKEKVLKNLRCVSLKKVESVPLDLSFMDFAESSTSDNKFGELILKEVWALKKDFGTNSVPACNFEWAKTVTACLNGVILVLDCGNKKVMTFTSRGVHIGTIDSKDPRGILVNPVDITLSTTCNSEKILVLDSAVKVFDREGNFLSQIVLPEGSTLAKCIDVGSGKIAIGTKEMILLYDEDGSNLISIPNKEIDKHITICSKTQSLIYTNYKMSKLVSVDFSGREIFKVSTVIKDKPVKPTGVCTDKTGDIYIAVHTGKERGTGEIHHYSPEGCYIGLVAEKLYNPVGLSFSLIGDLIVADRKSVKVFKRN